MISPADISNASAGSMVMMSSKANASTSVSLGVAAKTGVAASPSTKIEDSATLRARRVRRRVGCVMGSPISWDVSRIYLSHNAHRMHANPRLISSTTVQRPLYLVTAVMLAAAALAFVTFPTVMFATALFRIALVLLIALTHPLFLHKIDRLAAGVVMLAMLGPVLLMRRRHVEVNGFHLHGHLRWRNDHRLRIHHHGRGDVADVDAAIHAGLVDVDGNTDVGASVSGSDGPCGNDQSNELVHDVLSSVRTSIQRCRRTLRRRRPAFDTYLYLDKVVA